MAISTIGASALDSGVSQLGKNLIQNGAMTVAQRGGTMSLGSGGTTTYLPVDRFKISEGGGAARFDVSRDTSVVPSGFAYSLKVDCTTADGTVAGNDVAVIAQGIEAQNLEHLLYGAAGAKTLVCTFRVRSPKTGTHYVGLTQLDAERYYLRSYTVDVADTWETKTVTFPGDASGVINSDTGEGLRLFFALHGAGANFGSGVADAWTAWPAGVIQYMASDGVNVLDNAANNFYLAGVQLEVGSVATDFEHEDYGTTLAKCQRYYEQHDFDGASQQNISLVKVQTASATTTGFKYLTQKRAAPTITFSAANTFLLEYNGTTTSALSSIFADHITDQQCRVVPVVSSGLTVDEVAMWCRDATDTAFMKISAEL